MTVSWTNQADNETAFYLEVSTDGGATYPTIVHVASTVGPDAIRFVTHYDVSRAACVKAVEAMSEVMETAVAKA